MEENSCGILAIIGFMGSGKSTVGAILADKLGVDFVDLDEHIACEANMSINEIFEREGEDGFRMRESKALREELLSGCKVLSCGGGVVLRDENVERLRNGSRVYYLYISHETALKNLADGEGRPLLQGKELVKRVDELMEARGSRYLDTAHEMVEADDKDPEEIAEEIAVRWRRFRYEQQGGSTAYT